MSPLTRSLLALAALLAAADAYCTTKTFGRITQSSVQLPPVDVPQMDDLIRIPDVCPEFGRGQRVGETITACNKDPARPPPVIKEYEPQNLYLVFLSCVFCPFGMTVSVVEYCAY